MIYPQITMRLAIKKGVMELISTSSVFLATGTRVLHMRVPNQASPGEYWLHLDGSITANSSLLFQNRTMIGLNPKTVSLIIQVSREIPFTCRHARQASQFTTKIKSFDFGLYLYSRTLCYGLARLFPWKSRTPRIMSLSGG
uniref:Ig-like domain-containing protein n=1 Tax=Mesocestoides corti TaxID=53468 RepID=A0A5K3F8J3_MESCO